MRRRTPTLCTPSPSTVLLFSLFSSWVVFPNFALSLSLLLSSSETEPESGHTNLIFDQTIPFLPQPHKAPIPYLRRLSSHRGTKHLGPKEPTLRPLDDLLVHALRRVIHDDRAGLIVDLGVDTRVADQVHDPLLAFVAAEAETAGEVPERSS